MSLYIYIYIDRDRWIDRSLGYSSFIIVIIITDENIIFEKQMIRIPLNSENDHPSYQSVYMSDRFLKKPRLKIRRVV